MCAVPVGLKSSAEPRNDQVRTNRGNENSNKQPVHFEAPPKLSIPQTQADALLQNFVSAIEVNAGCGPPAARGRSRPASPCRSAQRSWRTPTQDHALAPGRACSDVALGLGDPKPRSVDAGKTFVGAAPGVGKTYAMLKDARPS